MVRRRKPAGGFNKSNGSGKKQSASHSAHRKPSSSKKTSLPANDEDLFFEGRDKILLDGSDASRGRDLEDYDDEEEVFALNGVGDSDSDAEADDYDEDEDEDEDGDDSEDDAEPTPSTSKSSKKPTKDAKGKTSKKSQDSDDDFDERWGKNKSAYYSSNAQDLDSDDEEARQLEEQEVLRLQAKAQEGITDDDYGLNDAVPTPNSHAAPSVATPATNASAPVPTAPLSKEVAIRHLEKTNPEVLALAREWEDIASQIQRVDRAISERIAANPQHPTLGMVYLHQQTLVTYAAVLAHYLHVRSTPIPGPTPNAPTRAKNVSEKVLERLLQLKHSLGVLDEIGFSILAGETEDRMEYGPSDEELSDEIDVDSEDEDSELDLDEAELDLAEKYSDAQLNALLSEMDVSSGSKPSLQKASKSKSKSSGLQPVLPEKQSTKVILKLPSKKKTKSSTTDAPSSSKKASPSTSSSTPAPIQFDLQEPEYGSYAKSLAGTSPSSSSSSTGPYNPFGDATSLSAGAIADKAERKRSLKFHTSKIESTARRRDAARQRAMGGDDDIPWRDERRERKDREQKAVEAARAGKSSLGQGGDDLDDVDPAADGEAASASRGGNDSKGKKRARDDDDDAGDEESPEGYYDLVQKSKKQAKLDKKAAYDAEVAASKPDFSEGDSSGPRSLTRAILKNKGLTPKRAKAVRNPRVKKKLRFEQAKKKVSSKRAVYKGGMSSLPGGRYEGERSGISQVVKSVKL
ncbi:hypothetical protein DL93DRAFT_2162747 [Clavulina sp. PMI_390]|nr:hypothetical protein DL93DRAFT_2162747 [Clavulina sp. PMI_390]